MRKAKLLILGATENQLPLVTTAKQLGLYTITADWDLNNIAHKYSDEQVGISTTDVDSLVSWLNTNPVKGIITSASDVALRTTALICNKFNIPGPNSKTIEIVTRKNSFRKFQLEHNLPHPFFYEFSKEEEALASLKKLKGNYIVKPTDSSGSKGIFIVNSQTSQDMDSLKSIIQEAFSQSFNKTIVVEEFIKGTDYTIEGFYKNSLIDTYMVTEKGLTDIPYRVPISHTAPSPLSPTCFHKIERMIDKYLRLLNVTTSPFDMDLLITPEGKLYLIEMSLRIGGNALPRIMYYSSGYDLHRASIAYSVGIKNQEKLPIQSKLTKMELIYSETSGKIVSLTDIKEIYSKFKPFIKEITYDYKIGDHVPAFSQGNHRLGHYIVQASTRQAINRICASIRKATNLQVKE